MAGSDRKPTDGDAGKGKQDFDDVWDALVERGSQGEARGDDTPTRDGAHDATEPPSSSSRTDAAIASGQTPADDVERTPPSASTKLWDDAARAEGLHAPGATAEPEAAAQPATAATKPWDDAARASAKPGGEAMAARSAEDMKMDALMAEAEAAKALRSLREQDRPEPAAAGHAAKTPWLERSDEWLERSDDEMDRIMTTQPAADPAEPSEPTRTTTGEGDEGRPSLSDIPKDEAEKQRTEAPAGEGASSDDQAKSDPAEAIEAGREAETAVASKNDEGARGGEPVPDQDTAARDPEPKDSAGERPRRGEGGAPVPPPEAGAGRGRIWILLVVIFGLFGLWRLLPERTDRPVVPTLDADRPGVPVGPAAEHPGGPPQPGPRSPDGSPMIERPSEPAAAGGEVEPEEPGDASPEEPEALGEEQEPGLPSDATPAPEHAEPEPRADAGDVRVPPPGTEPEHAAAFQKLPVGPGDGPPVGGVGEGGIHVDHIALGSSYGRGGCDGKLDDFSVSERDRVNVCLRVVHPREKEELVILWQKDGSTMRRGKLTIVPQHAYRTRAYLMLREPYVGAWVVRILSSGGVELASHEFQVVQ
jgi:hypothetical protein